MPAWTEGRLKTLIFVALLVVALAVLASLLYFRAGRRVPEGAEIVLGHGWTERGPGHRQRAVDLLEDLRSLWELDDLILGGSRPESGRDWAEPWIGGVLAVPGLRPGRRGPGRRTRTETSAGKGRNSGDSGQGS